MLQKLLQFIVQTYRSIKKAKVNFCLGFLACLIVVFVVALLTTIITKAPVIFLRLSELDNGEKDLVVRPGSWAPSNKLNFTEALSYLKSEDGFDYAAPRVEGSTLFRNLETCKSENISLLDVAWKYENFSCASGPSTGRLILFDEVLEERMGLGRAWEWDPLAEGEVAIQQEFASVLNVKEGDVLNIGLGEDYFGSEIWETIFPEKSFGDKLKDIELSMTIRHIIDSPLGKFSDDLSTVVLAEFSNFMKHTSKYLRPELSQHSNTFSNFDLYSSCDEIVINLPPNRVDNYISSDQDSIQNTVVDFATSALYKLGFSELESELPGTSFFFSKKHCTESRKRKFEKYFLEGLRLSAFFSLFLGLILNIIIFILLFLSIILLYSLLMINVETRTFEMGILRMLGMQRSGLILLLLLQAFAYAFPAWILGLILAQFSTFLVVDAFENLTGVPIPSNLSSGAIILATFLGTIIPLAASVFPIRAALGNNLHDSLDTNHSKTTAVKIDVERLEDKKMNWSVITIGIGMACFGFGTYYLLPLALLAQNFTLLLNMFMGLLVCMLLGLVVLSLNLEHFLERLVVFLFLWWDKNVIVKIMVKNLVGHRLRNRKTAIMYAVSLAFIIFVSVTFEMQLTTAAFQTQQQNGVLLKVEATGSSDNIRKKIEIVEELENYGKNNNLIESTSWITHSLDESIPFTEYSISNLGRTFSQEQKIFGVSPNLFNTTLPGFLTVNEFENPLDQELTLSRQLYTEDGSKSLVIGSAYKELIGAKIGEHIALQKKISGAGIIEQNSRRRLKPSTFLDSAPAFRYSQFPSVTTQSSLVSFTSYLRLSDGVFNNIEELPYSKYLIRLVDDATTEQKEKIISELKAIVDLQSGLEVWDYDSAISANEIASTILTYFSIFTTVVAMLISFFSLTSAMVTNIYEGRKEIAVVRAMGLKKGWLHRVYIYEAFVLVFTSSLLGILIGTLVGWTVVLQRVLFTQLPISLQFPYAQLIFVFIASTFFSYVSTAAPASRVTKQKITTIMKSLN